MSSIKIKVRPNRRSRTFTIREYFGSCYLWKYRTIQFPQDEFDQMMNNSEDDWKEFLNRCSYDYYPC